MSGDLTGRVIKSYELQQLIGEGGFGAVYRAYQQFIGREVAIKIILPQYANRPDFIRRFETEAQIVARLEHPHIVPLYDYWREPSGAYLVMRWLRGGSVHDSLENSGAWQSKAVSNLLNQIAEALAVAHRQGVIHRDLKPENIMLDENDNAYLTDFGIAKDLIGGANITQNNAIVGSPAYLSPEQIRGEGITPQSDIYAMGIVLFEMLTGERPFKDVTPATLMYKHLSEPIPDLSTIKTDLPSTINAVIQRATAKDPSLRYGNIIELARDFRRAIKEDEDSETTHGTALIPTSNIVLPEPENPYKGLRAFQQADSGDFYGREQLVETIVGRLKEADDYVRFLAVVGPSGSGKSSVVKAGVLPVLRNGMLPGSNNWFIVEMVPGIDPFEELEAALLRIAVNPPESLLSQLKEDERGLLRAVKRVLPDDDTELVLVIDQFEEIFTLVEEEELRTQFMDSLTAAVSEIRSRIRIIITLRADFYDRPLNYGRFGNLMRQRTEVVLPLNTEELEQAITKPAQHVGMELESGLVTSIITSIKDQPGMLPLLQYALTELFERRNGHTLTLAAYHEIGGTMGALAQRADELYDGLGDEGQEAARQLFLRLITLGEGAEDTRRRALQSELLSIGQDRNEMEMVVDAFGRYRLLTFDHDPVSRTATVEVAHEALIRQWQRLRDWLADNRDDLRTQRRIASAAEEWLNSKKDSSFLAGGARLEQFEAWYKTTSLALNEIETEYLNSSIAAREARLTAEKLRQMREEDLEKRSTNRLRALVAVMTVAAVVAIALALFALTQSQQAKAARTDAEANAEIAEINANEANSLALAANARNALNEHNNTLALALASEANNAFQPATTEVTRTLAGTAFGPGVRYRFDGHTGAVLSTVFSSNQEFSASSSADGTIRIWNNTTGQEALLISIPDTIITDVKFHPTQFTLAASASDGQIYLFNAETGEEIQRFTGHTDIPTSIDFSADGSQLLSGSLDLTLRLWDVQTGEVIHIFEDSPGAILAVALSPDGRYAVATTADETISNASDDLVDRAFRVWDVTTGELLHTVIPGAGFIRCVAISPDSKYAAFGTWSGTTSGVLRIISLETGDTYRELYGHSDIISGVVFSPDNSKLVSVSWDKSLRVWDVATGIAISQFDVFVERPLSVDISRDGQYTLVSTGNLGGNEIDVKFEASTDTSVWLIDLETRALVQELTGHEDWVWSTDISPDGKYIISGSGPLNPPAVDSSVRLWDASTGEEIRKFEANTDTVEGLAFSPSGDTFVSGAWDTQVILWNISGEEIRRFVGNSTPVKSVIFSPDGTQLATGAGDGILILWSVETGEEIRRFEGHTGDVAGLAFSPDGSQLVSGAWDNLVILWDVASGNEIRRFEGHTNWVNDVAFSPDGKSVLSGSWDSTVRLWDVLTGEQIHQFIGHNRAVQGVAISPDGKLALSGAGDTTMRLWDIETGQELFLYTGHKDWVSEVVFMPNGYALSSAQDNTLRIWQVPSNSQDIVAWAKENRYVRELTCGERDRYRVEPLCEDPS